MRICPLDRQIDGVQVTADTEGIKATLGEDAQVFSSAFVCDGNLYGSRVNDESASIFAVKSVAGKLALETVVTVPASSADGALITHDGKVGLVATDAIYFGDEKLVVDPPLGPIIRTSSQGLVFTDAPRTSGPQPRTVGTDLLPGVMLCEKLEPNYCDNTRKN